MTEFLGSVDIKNTSGSDLRIVLKGDSIAFYGNNGRPNIKIGKHEDLTTARFYDSLSIWNADGEKIAELTSLGSFQLGGGGVNGQFSLRDKKGGDSIILDGSNGDLTLYDADGGRGFALLSKAPSLSGNTTGMWIGASKDEGQKAGYVCIRNSDGQDSIELDGSSGDIILNNADCAEDFDIAESAEIEPGTVMVIDQHGKLRQSYMPYDKRVAGVVSGAQNYKPGLVLDKRKSTSVRKSVSLMGKVYCKADSQYGSIKVGDLLTTSNTPGHAMKATDPMKAFGSVIGKALGSLNQEIGLIPILVALQ